MNQDQVTITLSRESAILMANITLQVARDEGRISDEDMQTIRETFYYQLKFGIDSMGDDIDEKIQVAIKDSIKMLGVIFNKE